MTILELLDYLIQGGAYALALFILYLLYIGKLRFERDVLEAKQRELEAKAQAAQWQDLALRNLGLAQHATELATTRREGA